MFQPPDDFETNPFFNRRNKKDQQEEIPPEELADISPENLAYRKKELSKIFVWLLGFGLGLGIIVAIIVVIALNKLGLTKRPDELEPQPVKSRKEQVDQIWLKNLNGVSDQSGIMIEETDHK